METRVLFIIPPHISYNAYVHPTVGDSQFIKKDGKAYGVLFTDLPLGVLALSSWLKQYAKNTQVATRLINFNIDLNDRDTFDYASFGTYYRETLVQQLAEFQPDIIGISVLFTPSYQNMLEIGACCRDLFPQAIIVAGGSVPTSMYKQVFRDSSHFDALCHGEGEIPLSLLVDAEDRHQLLSQHDSWITRQKVAENRSYLHSYVSNLDDIPFYDYDLCAIEKYNQNTTFRQFVVGRKQTAFTLMSSLGCPFKCIFCASHKVHGRSMRYYSLARLEEDLTRLRDQYNAGIIVIMDDNVMGDRQRAVDLALLIHRLGMLPILQGITLFSMDRATLESLRQAGVDHLFLPIESGSDRVLKKIMHKPLKLSIVAQVVNDCRDLGIYTNANILLGLPGETKKDIEDARAFLKTITPNWYSFFAASPLVGSEMYEICVEKNYLKEWHLESSSKRAVVETEDFTAEYIQEMTYLLNLELNFIMNSDMRLGQYHLALKGFANALRAKHDHFFAHYYSARCHEQLGEVEKAAEYDAKARQIYGENPYWRNYADHFNVVPKEGP